MAGPSSADGKNPILILGVENPEDIMDIPGADWIVTSAYSDAIIPDSRSFFVNKRTHELRPAYPGNCRFELDRKRFGDVEPPDFIRFHGLDVVRAGDVVTLYQVNHPLIAGPRKGAGRESVEVFDIEITKDGPSLIWRGAVMVPSWAATNDVCALPGGGFAVTNTHFKGPEGFDMAFAGRSSGNVLEWIDRQEGWRIVEGSDVNSPNGIAVSDDGEYYFIACWGASKVLRLSRSDPHGSRIFVDTGAMIDNITWTPDRCLLLAGQISDRAAYRKAHESGVFVTTPFKAIKLDPRTMKTEVLLHEESDRWLATTALQTEHNEIWIGSIHCRHLLVYRS